MTSAPTTRRELRAQSPSPVPPGRASPQPSRRRTGGVLGEVLLWAAAAAGVVCVVLVVLALTAHITLIMFRTGSMSPTIPAGSVAVVQQIPAAEVAVGDVVTVDRPGKLPVTHRVREIAPGATAAERLLTLRGDANAQDDAEPYPVTKVRIVRFAIPGLAPVIVSLGNPLVLGGITLAAALLVGWAFWPRGARDRRRGGEQDPEGAGAEQGGKTRSVDGGSAP